MCMITSVLLVLFLKSVSVSTLEVGSREGKLRKHRYFYTESRLQSVTAVVFVGAASADCAAEKSLTVLQAFGVSELTLSFRANYSSGKLFMWLQVNMHDI